MTTETPTPETDAALDATEPSNIREVNLMLLCRQLERQRDQLKLQNDAATDLLQDAFMIAKREGLGTNWDAFKKRLLRHFDKLTVLEISESVEANMSDGVGGPKP